MRELERRRGIVALVGDRDNLCAKTEREQQLGGVRYETYDAH
jgi:hypothetical protein